MKLQLSKPHTKLNDGPIGLVYVWELENGYTFSVIDMFSYFQRMYGEKYEVLVKNKAGNYVSELSNEYTSSIDKLEEVLEYVASL